MFFKLKVACLVNFVCIGPWKSADDVRISVIVWVTASCIYKCDDNWQTRGYRCLSWAYLSVCKGAYTPCLIYCPR